MAIARRTFTWKAKPDNPNESKPLRWTFRIWIYRGRFGRFEAWNEGDGEEHQIGNFPTRGARSYAFTKITLDGRTVFSNGEQLPNDYIDGISLSPDQGIIKVLFKASAPVTKNSVITYTIAQQSVWIPWLWYKFRPEFLYHEQKGMLDPAATPASAIAISQDLDMDINVPNTGIIGLISLSGGVVGLSFGVAISEMLAASNFSLDGYGFLRLINYEDGALDSADIDQGAIIRQGPKPVLGYKYWIGWYVVSLNAFNPLPGLDLSLIMPGAAITVEYQLLKYQKMLTDELYQTCLYPFILVGNPIGNDGNPAQTPLDYRRDIFLREVSPNTPRLIDRLVHISTQSAGTLTRPEQRVFVPTYSEFESIVDEYNFINPKIKVGKLVRLHGVKFKSKHSIETLLGRPYGRGNDPIVGLYEMEINKELPNNLAFIESLKERFPLHDDATEKDSIDYAAANTRIFVLVEDQAASDLDEINTSDFYSLGGKMMNPAFLYAAKAFNGARLVPNPDKSIFNVLDMDYVPDPNYTGDSLMAEGDYPKWTSISKDIVELLLHFRGNPYAWVIVVRGRGATAEEEATKDAYSDYIMKAPEKPWEIKLLPKEAKPGVTDYDLSSIRPVPLISLSGFRSTVAGTPEIDRPVQVTITYSEDGENFKILTKKLILPHNPKFTYRYNDEFLAPLVKGDIDDTSGNVEFLYMNYPEGGFSRRYRGTNNQSFRLPILQIPMDPQEGSGFPLKSDNFALQVIRDGQVYPYQADPNDPFSPHPTLPGWVPIYEDGMFVGIRLNQAYSEDTESHIHYVRIINISAKDVTRVSVNPLKRAKKIAITHNGPVALAIALNQETSDEITNLEAVGISRITPTKNQYQELVPGRGLKVYSGHGISFQPSDSADNQARAGRVQGALNFPFAEIDAFGENALPEEDAPEANGVSSVGHGAEILAETTMGISANNSDKILSFYTSTILAEEGTVDDIKISAFYDRLKDEHVVIYTKGDNRMYVKSSNMEWAEPYFFRAALANSQFKDGFALHYANHKYEKPIYLGFDAPISEALIQSVQTSAGEITGRLSDGSQVTCASETKRLVLTFNAPGNTNLLVQSIRVSLGNGATANVTKIPDYPNNLADTIFCKLVYATQENAAEELTYGFTKSLGYVEPKYFFLTAPKDSADFSLCLLECPIIENPAYIAVEIIVPDGLSAEEFAIYSATVAKAKISTNCQVRIVKEDQVQAGVSAAMLRNNANETFVFYETKKLFNDDGELLADLEEGHITSMQVVSSTDGLKRWISPKMRQGEVVTVDAQAITQEKERLAEAGYNSVQIDAFVRSQRRWDRPLNISTLASPAFIFDNMSDSILIFGFTGPKDNGDLIMWQIHEAVMAPAVTFKEIEDVNLGGLSFTSMDLENKVNKSNTVARGIPHQTVAVSFTSSKNIFVMYEATDGILKTMFSTDKGYSWQESKIELFKPDAYFNNVSNVYVMPNHQTEDFRFFGLVKDDSITGFKLYTYVLPQSYFTLSDPVEIEQTQALVDKLPKTLVVGDANAIPEVELTTPIKTRIGNAYKTQGGYINLPPYTRLSDLNLATGGKEIIAKDENIRVKHTVAAYVDPYGKIRVYYLNSQMRIACKISEDGGFTWKTDYGV